VEAGVPVLVVVWTGGLFEQWETRLMRELGLQSRDIGRVRGAERSIKPITIAMQQTLWRGMTPAFLDTWGMVVCDEVQRAASKTFMDVLDKFPARYRIGISADETRADRKEFLVYDLFGDVAHEVSQDDLIDEGSVLDVECRVVPTEFRADWYVAARASGTPDFNRLLGEMAEDETRNALALDLVLAEVAAGNQVLVLSHRVEHCQRFDAALAARAVPCDLMLGGDEWKARFDATKRGLADGSLRVAAGTIQAIGTGIDLPAVGRGVLTTPIGSNRQLYGQVRGRLCRPGKADAVLYVLWDRHVHGESALKFLARWNRTTVVRTPDGAWLDVSEYNRRQAT
jgi:superfamily II DNA or RNA helicase